MLERRASGRLTEGSKVMQPRTLLLLHGLGATAEVWTPFRETLGDAVDTVIAPDLRGHGRTSWRDSYRLDDFASDVAEMLSVQGVSDYVALGHSMGGAVALALANGTFGPQPRLALGLGIKVAWTEAESVGLAKRAASPPRIFATRDEAVDRYLKSAGLSRLIDPASNMALAGVTAAGEGWRLACDPRTGEVGAPPMDDLIANACCPVALGCGEHDALVSVDQLRAWDAKAQALAGLGHNAMVENPAAVGRWLSQQVAAIV